MSYGVKGVLLTPKSGGSFAKKVSCEKRLLNTPLKSARCSSFFLEIQDSYQTRSFAVVLEHGPGGHTPELRSYDNLYRERV